MTIGQRLEAAFASMWRHGLVLLFFLFLPLATTWPLAAHLGTHVPGEFAGDNLSTLWSFWWMRQALASSDVEFWRTTLLFYPGGVDLVQHTHTALNALIGATVLGGVSEITALNVVLLGVLTLAGFGTYLLAWDITGHRGASIVAGVFFCASPFFAVRLLGHFNLVSAWGLPFFAWVWLRALRTDADADAGADVNANANASASGIKASGAYAIAAGVVLAAIAYSDYYYLVYSLLFAVCVLALRRMRIRWERSASTASFAWTWIDSALVVLIVIAIVLHTAIVMTGGFTWHIAGARISMRNGLNVRTVAWVLALVLAWRRITLRPRVERVVANGSIVRDAGLLAVALIVFALASWPLIQHTLQILQRGEYVELDKRWHSAPIGVDPLAVLFGNPFHPLYGAASRAVYAWAEIDRLEQIAWFGVPAMIILIAQRRGWRRLSPHPYPSPTGEGFEKSSPSPAGEGAGGEGTNLARDAMAPMARLWIGIAAIFGVWALGPYLRILGTHTGLWLPASLTQYVPILSSARMPSRAMVMVYLSVAVLLSIALAARQRATGRPPRAGADAGVMLAIVVVILIDFAAQPIALYRIDRPALFQQLAAMPPGAVCALPLGLRDGIGELGRFEHRALADQMIHGKPIIGGFIARLPKPVFQQHEQAPIIGSLLRLSSGEALPEADLARDRDAISRGGLPFGYIVLYPADTAPQLRAYVTSVLHAKLVRNERGIELYTLK
jgi:hypothetical protein